MPTTPGSVGGCPPSLEEEEEEDDQLALDGYISMADVREDGCNTLV